MPLNTPPPGRFLAFDTSTETLSVGVGLGEQLWLHSGPGAAQASTTLIPSILSLLKQAGLQLRDLDAIVFGRGPGSFTGLRTACAVAQGLAFGSGRPVLAIDTLHAVAEAARHAEPDTACISAVLDARMNEVYVQHFRVEGPHLQALAACQLCAPEAVTWPGSDRVQRHRAAGNALRAYNGRLPALPTDSAWIEALPTAAALLRLAPQRLDQAVPADQALPLYIRDKVALTTEERAAAQAAAAA
jgi:tRNA threonylcarbamoyladenosine biosynthesis protein TsaB